MTWKRKISFPCPVMDIGEIVDILFGELDPKEIEELAEELRAFHRPIKRIFEPFDGYWD